MEDRNLIKEKIEAEIQKGVNNILLLEKEYKELQLKYDPDWVMGEDEVSLKTENESYNTIKEIDNPNTVKIENLQTNYDESKSSTICLSTNTIFVYTIIALFSLILIYKIYEKLRRSESVRFNTRSYYYKFMNIIYFVFNCIPLFGNSFTRRYPPLCRSVEILH